jgi:hypothetical protein
MNISGFSTESLASVEQLLYGEIDWTKQFKSGKGPGPEKKENYDTGTVEIKGIVSARIGKKGPGNMGKQKDNESGTIAGPALPKGPGNPQSGSSKEVFGMRALG